MSEITLIGLGAMGSALAQALLKAEREVTIWNRSPKKMQPLMRLGAKGTTDLGEAMEASSRLMICITDYAATSLLLDQPGLPSLLKDRTVIQFSTGTPKEAAEFDTWVKAQGGTYLDGAIMVNPAATEKNTAISSPNPISKKPSPVQPKSVKNPSTMSVRTSVRRRLSTWRCCPT